MYNGTASVLLTILLHLLHPDGADGVAAPGLLQGGHPGPGQRRGVEHQHGVQRVAARAVAPEAVAGAHQASCRHQRSMVGQGVK